MCSSIRLWISPRHRAHGLLAVLLLVAAMAAPWGAQADQEPECSIPFKPPVKKVEGLPKMGEVSGLAASKRYPGWGWMIRDSGHPPLLYTLRFDDGEARTRVVPVPGASNRDWEDINYSVGPDGKGRLWVVESGQSGKARFIYEILEPDPATALTAKLVRRYTYAYPDRGYNTEASFMFNGDLVLVAKTNPARLYRFDKALSPNGVNKPAFVGVLRSPQKPSVSRLSPDGRFLVTASHQTVHVYRNGGDLGSLKDLIAGPPVIVEKASPGDNVESGDFFPWNSCSLLLLAESHNTYWMRPR
jgi:hypothetical protein